jgi:hypothetical protein
MSCLLAPAIIAPAATLTCTKVTEVINRRHHLCNFNTYPQQGGGLVHVYPLQLRQGHV